ncbi:aromatic-ring-hydroxylating dioxygenase subunit beta [Bauldia sp.]|uniref:aromatic-ring-hydroxylating dioxygenase subunit beta n=1 Tax=Bauldia sp. TaxID=2575872 RepID=UPI003BA981A5
MNAPVHPNTKRVVDLYDELVRDRDATLHAPTSGDAALAAEAALLLKAEARLLDARAFDRWLTLWEQDAVCWVPLATGSHPGQDQALFLDDRRRLEERVWRMGDRSAWALWPAAETIRNVGGFEAWTLDELDGVPPASGSQPEILVVSLIHIHHVRSGQVTNLTARQIHRLRRTDAGLRLRRKTMLFPQLTAGTPHLGWLM